MKKLLAKGTAITVMAAVAGGLLTGCGGNKGKGEEAADGKMKLELWTSNRDILDNQDAYFVKKIEDTFDVGIEMKYRNEGSTDYQEWLTLSMAGGDAPDWFRDQVVSAQMLNDFADDEVIAELDPEMIKKNMPNLMKYYEKYENIFGTDPLNLYSVDGKIYSIPDAYPASSKFCLMCVRQDWLDNLGLEMPETLDELESVLKAFTFNDPDGNGVDDTYGYIGITGEADWAFSPIYGAFGVYPGIWYAKEDGTITRGELEIEPMKEALTYIKKLYDEGVIDPEWMTVDFNSSQNKVVSSVDGVCWQNWLSILTKDGWYSSLYQSEPDASFAVSSGPVGPNGDQGIMQFNPLAGVGLVFSKEMEEQPEKMEKYMQIFDTIAGDPSWYEALVWGEEGKTYAIGDNGDREYIGEYVNEDARTNFGIGTSYAFPSLETFQYDPEVHDQITYDAETYGKRQQSYDKITGEYDVLGNYYLPKYSDTRTELESSVKTALTEFITGKRDIAQYDEFVQSWYDGGGKEALEEAQQIYDKHFK